MDFRSSLPRSIAALALALLLVSAGCSATGAGPGASSNSSGTGSSGAPSAATIGQKADQKYANLTSYRGTMRIQTVVDGKTTSTTGRIWEKPHKHEMRMETLSPSSKAGNVVDSNGSVLWTYNATRQTVTRLKLQNFGSQTPTTDYASVLSNITKKYHLTYRGKHTVAGRSTYEVSLSPKKGTPEAKFVRNETIWFDTDHWFPLKTHVTTSMGNHTTAITKTYTNISFNTGIDDSRFDYRPPANATVKKTSTPSVQTYHSVAKAQAHVNYTIVKPSPMPDGYTLKQATLSIGPNATSTTLEYDNGSGGSFLVGQKPIGGGQSTTHPPGKTITIDGQNATYGTLGNSSIISWKCGGFHHSFITELPKQTALEIANSTACAA